MSTNEPELPDPDDMFKDTRMSFGDHIDDLRTHLLKAVYAVVAGMFLALWPLGPWVLKIIVSPVEEQLDRFEERKGLKGLEDVGARSDAPPREVAFTLKINRIDLDNLLDKKEVELPVLDIMSAGFGRLLDDLDVTSMLNEENRKLLRPVDTKRGEHVRLPVTFTDSRVLAAKVQEATTQVRGRRLATMNITEAFMVYLKVSGLTGLVISSPYVFYQIWMFIAAGLYPHEKRLVHVYLPFSLFLFITGVLMCQFLVMPKAIEAMLWFNEWLGLDADLRLNEWLGFALMMPLVFGISFQTPLVMMFAHKVGFVRDRKSVVE